jgi:hypothetical protein
MSAAVTLPSSGSTNSKVVLWRLGPVAVVDQCKAAGRKSIDEELSSPILVLDATAE